MPAIRQFAAEVIFVGGPLLSVVPGQLACFPIDLPGCGGEVDQTTVFRWIQAYVREIEKQMRPYLHQALLLAGPDQVFQ
ncbi:MAG: hypothetical protein ACLPID_11485 [Beijerinckiaceae bacterium]